VWENIVDANNNTKHVEDQTCDGLYTQPGESTNWVDSYDSH
jgi:hypothetical protein